MTVNARKFVTTDIKSVVERANEILIALKDLGLETDETYEFAKLRSEDRPDRWERAAWILATLELADAIAKKCDPDGVSWEEFSNGGFDY